MIDAPGDAERRADLKRMRGLATALLLVAAVIYALTLRRTPDGWLGWVNAGSEAAMVGALADWFAVTAIFRHPLGIPVPHTALVKKRKNDLGRSLQQFVTNNFLAAAIVREHVIDAQLARRIGQWLADAGHRRRLLQEATRGGHVLLARIDDEQIGALVEQTLLPRLREQPLAATAGRLLQDVVRDGSHQQGVELLARELHTWLQNHPEVARSVIGERAPRWSPGWLDRQVVEFGYAQALEWTMAVRMQPEHPFRRAIDGYLEKIADDLQHDPTMMERAEGLKRNLLDNPSLVPAVLELWGTVRGSLADAMDDPASPLWTRADAWLAGLASQLEGDEALRTRLDERIGDLVAVLVETYGDELATVISVTVDRWDAEEASQRIELFVGPDLQFIRINGTVVGCLAGLAIHALSLLA